MMPNDTFVIRYRPGDADRSAARRLLKELIAVETAICSGSAPETTDQATAMTRTLNKLLQDLLSVLAKGAPVSVIVVDDTSLLDVRDTAEILGYDHTHVTRLLKKGGMAVHPHRAGRKRLVPAQAVIAKIEQDPSGHAIRIAKPRRSDTA